MVRESVIWAIPDYGFFISLLLKCHCLYSFNELLPNATTGDKKTSFGGQKMGARHSLGDIWGAKLGNNLQTNNTQNKNLQKPEQSLTLENKRFTGLYLQIICVSLQSDYFPTHHRQSIEYQRSVNLIGTWLFFESFSKVSESANV